MLFSYPYELRFPFHFDLATMERAAMRGGKKGPFTTLLLVLCWKSDTDSYFRASPFSVFRFPPRAVRTYSASRSLSTSCMFSFLFIYEVTRNATARPVSSRPSSQQIVGSSDFLIICGLPSQQKIERGTKIAITGPFHNRRGFVNQNEHFSAPA